MANFEYSGVDAAIRDAEFEQFVERLSPEVAEQIADKAGLPDSDENDAYEVVGDAAYDALISETKGYLKTKK